MLRRLHGFIALLAFLQLAPVPRLALAANVAADPSNYLAQLATLMPGDTLTLASGTYNGGLPITNMSGTAAQPIVIQGPADQSAVFTAQSCCNTVEIDTSSYIRLYNLTLDGSRTDGAFGVDGRNTTHDITIENFKIVNFNGGGDQQIVGIGTKGPAWNWVIRHNTIIDAGTGIYLGNSDGSDPFVGGLIEQNLIYDTIGYNMEIKQQNPRPTGIGMPTGDTRTIIRNNVFGKQNNGSTGALARPNVLVGHFPLSGAGVNDLYEIYGNFFYENPTEALFQGEGNIAFYDNVLVNDFGDAVNIQPQNDVPKTITLLNNTVVATGNGLNLTGAAAGYVQQIVGNASFAAAPVRGPGQSGNVTDTYANAAMYLNAPSGALGFLDLYPKAGQLTGTAVNLAAFASLAAAGIDFNGTARTGVTRGAYEGQGTNPGWKLALAFKGTSGGGGGGTPSPTLSLSATPAQIAAQGTASLRWSSTNATSCQASGGWSGTKAPSGNETSVALASTMSFTLTCTGAGGSANQMVSVVVVAAPAVRLTAAAASVAAGSSTSLTWSSTNATSCTASDGWSGTIATSGAQSVGPLNANATFQLTCTGIGGSGSASTSVSVAPAKAAPAADPTPAASGKSGGGGLSPGFLLALAGGLLLRISRFSRVAVREPGNCATVRPA